MEKEKIKREIVQYLIRFPNAQDSIEGIAHWWVNDDEKKVEGVIVELVEEKILKNRECALKPVSGLMNFVDKD
ncbi:MAG: hypothetical protein V3W19_12945 [Desulfatiglandales bacterium]